MKQNYKITTSLDKSYLDTEVAMQFKSGVGLRPLPLKIIGLWIATGAIVFLSIISDHLPIHYLPLIFKIIYGLCILAIVFFSTMTDMGGQVRFAAIRNMCIYMFNKKSRTVKTRSTDNATAFAHIVGIVSINEKTGMIKFADGSYAFAYRIVGNASNLLFDDDKNAIITRVDNFYRKLPDYMRCSYVTIKEPQKVATQKLHLRELLRGANGKIEDPDVRAIIQDSYKALDEFVGREFRSIHQYLFLYANSVEYLNKAHTILQNEHHASGLMFSSIEPLYYDDVVRCLHSIYGE